MASQENVDTAAAAQISRRKEPNVKSLKETEQTLCSKDRPILPPVCLSQHVLLVERAGKWEYMGHYRVGVVNFLSCDCFKWSIASYL